MNNRKPSESMESAASTVTNHAGETLGSINASLFKVIDQNRTIAQEMMRALQEQSLRFVNLRLEHTGRAIERSRDCHGLSELVAIQHEWMMDIARDYAEMTQRFADVLRDASEHNGAAKDEPVPAATQVQKSHPTGERAAAA